MGDDGRTATSYSSPRRLSDQLTSELNSHLAVDRIDDAETGARYEYLDLVAGGRAEGLTREETRRVVRAFDVPTALV